MILTTLPQTQKKNWQIGKKGNLHTENESVCLCNLQTWYCLILELVLIELLSEDFTFPKSFAVNLYCNCVQNLQHFSIQLNRKKENLGHCQFLQIPLSYSLTHNAPTS